MSESAITQIQGAVIVHSLGMGAPLDQFGHPHVQELLKWGTPGDILDAIEAEERDRKLDQGRAEDARIGRAYEAQAQARERKRQWQQQNPGKNAEYQRAYRQRQRELREQAQ
jgi:hypothetical protein